MNMKRYRRDFKRSMFTLPHPYELRVEIRVIFILLRLGFYGIIRGKPCGDSIFLVSLSCL